MKYRDYQPDQMHLLPQSLREWLPDDHLCYFINDLVEQLDLSAIYDSYDGSQGGQPPYHPLIMMKLLKYILLLKRISVKFSILFAHFVIASYKRLFSSEFH